MHLSFFKVYLTSSGQSTTVEEVETLIKKHEDFEKLLATQEEKVINIIYTCLDLYNNDNNNNNVHVHLYNAHIQQTLSQSNYLNVVIHISIYDPNRL